MLTRSLWLQEAVEVYRSLLQRLAAHGKQLERALREYYAMRRDALQRFEVVKQANGAAPSIKPAVDSKGCVIYGFVEADAPADAQTNAAGASGSGSSTMEVDSTPNDATPSKLAAAGVSASDAAVAAVEESKLQETLGFEDDSKEDQKELERLRLRRAEVAQHKHVVALVYIQFMRFARRCGNPDSGQSVRILAFTVEVHMLNTVLCGVYSL